MGTKKGQHLNFGEYGKWLELLCEENEKCLLQEQDLLAQMEKILQLKDECEERLLEIQTQDDELSQAIADLLNEKQELEALVQELRHDCQALSKSVLTPQNETQFDVENQDNKLSETIQQKRFLQLVLQKGFGLYLNYDAKGNRIQGLRLRDKFYVEYPLQQAQQQPSRLREKVFSDFASASTTPDEWDAIL